MNDLSKISKDIHPVPTFYEINDFYSYVNFTNKNYKYYYRGINRYDFDPINITGFIVDSDNQVICSVKINLKVYCELDLHYSVIMPDISTHPIFVPGYFREDAFGKLCVGYQINFEGFIEKRAIKNIQYNSRYNNQDHFKQVVFQEAYFFQKFHPDTELISLNNNAWVINMPFFEGDDLFDFVVKNKCNYPIEDAYYYSLEMLRAVKKIHDYKIVHRDLKPENVIINERERKLTIIDFGLSSEFGQSVRFHNQYTPQYSPPEIKLPIQENGCVDIFMTGIIIALLHGGESLLYKRLIKVNDPGKSYSSYDIINTDLIRRFKTKYDHTCPSYTNLLRGVIFKMTHLDKTSRVQSVDKVIGWFEKKLYPLLSEKLIKNNRTIFARPASNNLNTSTVREFSDRMAFRC